MITRTSFGWVGLSLAVLLQTATPANAARDLQCDDKRYALDRGAKRIRMDLRYPKGQASMAGEGWVRLGYTVTPTGEVAGIWLIDIIGAPIFAHAAAGSLVKAKFEPAILGGKPVTFHGDFDSEFRMSGDNRAGVHAKVGTAYDRALAAREQGDYAESVEILKKSLSLTLNMYEYAITSYGLTVSYLGLQDRRRALRHARHTAMGEAGYADRGQRRSALAFAAELESRDNNFRRGLCTFEALKKHFPDFQANAALQAEMTRARAELAATTPLKSEVEIVETDREDLAPMWVHEVVRNNFQLAVVQGTLKNYRLVCPTATSEGPIGPAPVPVDRSTGPCTLYVFGERGAKFVLDER